MNSELFLAKKIKSIRERFDLSQARFGSKIGLTGKTISAYENGRCVPPLRVLEKISSVYGEYFISTTDVQRKSFETKLFTIKKYIEDIENLLER